MNLLIKRNQACCEIPRKLASSTYKNSAFCQDFHPIPDLKTDWQRFQFSGHSPSDLPYQSNQPVWQ
jgi:hypothetical protein